jgi:choline dehydrogenase-like flavoprotein
MLVLGILMFSQAGLAAGLKKWKDKDGQWHFGDVIPPEYSQSAHEELNKQGMIIEVQPRAKTAAEIAEQKKKEAIAAEKKKQAEEQARHDQILLDTFSSVDDLEMARDGKEAAIKSRISLAEKRIENLQQDLDGRMAAAAAQERSGKTPSK